MKNNEWLVWLIAIVAVVALVIAIVALNKASLTGQGIFEWFKNKGKIEVNINASQNSGGDCQQPAFNQCVVGCEGSNPYSYDNCIKNCGDIYCSNTLVDSGLLGLVFLANSGKFEMLKGYEVKYDENGNLIYESKNGGTEI